MNRIDRLFAILTTLQSRKFATADLIAEKYQISLRTVYRDLKALGEIGVPIGFESKKGYSVLKGFFLAPISLTSDEANALILMVSLSEKFADKTIRQNSDLALNKIKTVLKAQDQENAEYIYSRIKIYKSPEEKHSTDFLTEIQNAIIHKKIIKVQYKNNQGIISKREIEPIGLTFYTNQWHLIAWCWERNAYRDFKVQSLASIVNTDKEFKKTDHYDLNEYIKSLS